MKEPTNQEDEFDKEEERQQAYSKAVQQLAETHEERMRDKHGDQR